MVADLWERKVYLDDISKEPLRGIVNLCYFHYRGL